MLEPKALSFPSHPFPFSSFPTLSQDPYLLSLPLTHSSRDFLTKFKFVIINRPFSAPIFTLLCLPSAANPAGFSFCFSTDLVIIINKKYD